MEHHKLVDEFLTNHPLVLNGLRDDSIERQEQEATIMTSANAVMEAAKLNMKEVRDIWIISSKPRF